MKKLSKRLENIIDMIRPSRMLLDIGCDHGFVCIRAVEEGKAENAVAADVSPGPLGTARGNIEAAGLSDRIRCVLSDGFRGLGGCFGTGASEDRVRERAGKLPDVLDPDNAEGSAEGLVQAETHDDMEMPEEGLVRDAHGRAAEGLPVSHGSGSGPCLKTREAVHRGAFPCQPECVVITGMGGHLIADILRGAGEAHFRPEAFSQMIIGAQSDLEFVRRFLVDELKVRILSERCVYEEGKYYLLFDTVPRGSGGGGEAYTDEDYFLGKYISKDCIDVYRDYLWALRRRLLAAYEAVERASLREAETREAKALYRTSAAADIDNDAYTGTLTGYKDGGGRFAGRAAELRREIGLTDSRLQREWLNIRKEENLQ